MLGEAKCDSFFHSVRNEIRKWPVLDNVFHLY